MVFENNQATQRIVSHHLKRIIHQHREALLHKAILEGFFSNIISR